MTKQQTFDQIKERCLRCGVIPHYTYKCSECNKPICESCYPFHRNECTLINRNHNHTQTMNQNQLKEMKTTDSVYKYKCSICNKKEMQRIVCPDCKQQFCIEHRKQFSHNCQKNSQVQNKTISNGQKTENNQTPQKKQSEYIQWSHNLTTTEKMARLKNKMNC